MLRSAYALGGFGSGIAENKEKLIAIAQQVYQVKTLLWLLRFNNSQCHLEPDVL